MKSGLIGQMLMLSDRPAKPAKSQKGKKRSNPVAKHAPKLNGGQHTGTAPNITGPTNARENPTLQIESLKNKL